MVHLICCRHTTGVEPEYRTVEIRRPRGRMSWRKYAKRSLLDADVPTLRGQPARWASRTAAVRDFIGHTIKRHRSVHRPIEWPAERIAIGDSHGDAISRRVA